MAVFFYSNEGNEPMHVHARKGGAECKFWIDAGRFEIEEAFANEMTPQLRREIRQVIFEGLLTKSARRGAQGG